MTKLDLTADEASRLAAGATVLARPVETCCREPDVTFDDDLPLNCCGNCGQEWFSPFPPVGSECEAFGREYKPGLHAEKFRVRVTGLDVRRCADVHEGSITNLIFDYGNLHRRFRDWWTDHFPEAPFDKSFCWIATITREAAKEE